MNHLFYFNIDLVYLLVNAIILITFCICGRNISNNKSYVRNAFMCILIYSLGLGLRYGRGFDYFHYIDIYNYDLEETQVVFTLFNTLLKSIGVGQYYIFVVYNFIEMACAMVFLFPFRRYAYWAFPLFMIATRHLNEYTIRQGFAFSFVFLLLYFFFKHFDNLKAVLKNAKFLILIGACLFVAYGIHSVAIITILWVTSFAIFIKKPLPYLWTIIALILASYVFQNMFDFSFANNLLAFMASQDDKFSQYVENSVQWFSADAASDRYTRNTIVKVAETFGIVSLFYLGSKVIKRRFSDNRQIITLYNVFVCGTILQKFFMNFEIVNRVSGTASLFWCIPLALVLYYRNDFKTSKDKVLLFFLIWWSYEYLKYLFMCGDMCQFLWDTPYF